jgi:sigma-B regulation protein RsbU (phosphoserine phosphatase)
MPRDRKIAYTVIQPNLPPLGIREALGVGAAQMVPIRAGLRLTAYSDGLQDMANSRRERYGEKRTFELLKKFHGLPQRDLRQILEKEVAGWTGAAPNDVQGAASLADDVTLVDIRFV